MNEDYSLSKEVLEALNSKRPFEINRDYKLRDAILQIDVDWERDEFRGDLMHFDAIDIVQFKGLLVNRFINPNDIWNNAPSVRSFFTFMAENPGTRAHGYAISPFREDYRITIEGLLVAPDDATSEIRDAFKNFSETADDVKIGAMLWCWWD
jgi:hypothetical protein